MGIGRRVAVARQELTVQYAARLRRAIRRAEAALGTAEATIGALGLEPSEADRTAREIELRTRYGGRPAYPCYPTSGDPNIIGEHEVAPVRCECCDAVIPWNIIMGWRN